MKLSEQKTAHTPGPWNYTNSAPVAVFDSCGNRIASVHETFWRIASRPSNRLEFIANARLIAAAPEMLKALQDIYEDPYLTCSCAERARAAIELAT